MSQTPPPEQRALSFLQMRTTLRQGKDWSLIIWANSSSTSPREFEASHELLLALLDFGGQTYLESGLSDVGREAGLRAEILRLAGPAADTLSQKIFLQVVFPSETYRFLACHLLWNSFACEEYRPPPTPPPKDPNSHWILPDNSVHWHGTKFRIEEFLDDVDEAMAGRRMAQHSWDDPKEEETSSQSIDSPADRPSALQVAFDDLASAPHQSQDSNAFYPMTPISNHSTSPRKRRWVWESTIDEEYGLKSPPPTPTSLPEPVPHGRVVSTEEKGLEWWNVRRL